MGKLQWTIALCLTLFTTTEQWIQLVCDFRKEVKEVHRTDSFFNWSDGVGGAVHND